MRVAVVGGSGRFGSALAWALCERGTHVIIGSRTAERAVEAAGLLGAEVAGGAVLEGARNAAAVAAAEIAVLCVPPHGHARVLAEIAPAAAGRVVVDACVCRHPFRPQEWAPPAEGSAAARARRLLPRGAAVAATLHSVSIPVLRPGFQPGGDVLVAAEARGAFDAAGAVLGALGLQAVEAGDLGSAPGLEHLAVLLSRLSAHHGVRSARLRLENLPRHAVAGTGPGR